MNELQIQIFNNQEFGQVRVLEIDGQPWFVAADVCNILELSNPSVAIQRLDEDERSKFNLGRQGKTNIVNEYGLYNLILASRKPEAKKFKRWVTHEVIPSIKKHGGYLTPKKVEEVLLNPDTIIQLATQLKEERARRIESERFIGQISASQNSILVRELAKVASKDGLVIGEKRLWAKLREWGLIVKGTTEPKQEYVDRGYFEVIEGTRESNNGVFTYRTTRITGKGQIYIIKRLLKEKGETA